MKTTSWGKVAKRHQEREARRALETATGWVRNAQQAGSTRHHAMVKGCGLMVNYEAAGWISEAECIQALERAMVEAGRAPRPPDGRHYLGEVAEAWAYCTPDASRVTQDRPVANRAAPRREATRPTHPGKPPGEAPARPVPEAFPIAVFRTYGATDAEGVDLEWGELRWRVENPTAPQRTPPAAPAANTEKTHEELWFLGALDGDTRDRSKGGMRPLCHSLLCVDYDDDPDVSPERIREWWGRWAFLAHTTASHEREKKDAGTGPRWHVLIPLARPVPTGVFEKVGRWALQRGAGRVGPETAKAKTGWGAPVGWEPYESLVNEGGALDPDHALEELAYAEALAAFEKWEADHANEAPAGGGGTSDALDGYHVSDCAARFLERARRVQAGGGSYMALPGGLSKPLEDTAPRVSWQLRTTDRNVVWNRLWLLIGPWAPDMVCVLNGHTGRGKSGFAVQTAEQAARRWPEAPDGSPVLYASAEMGTDELIARLLAQRSETSIHAAAMHEADRNCRSVAWRDLVRGRAELEHLESACAALVKDCPKLYLWSPPTNQRTAEGLWDAARSLYERHQAWPLIVVDYLQRFTPSSDDQRRIAIGDLSATLREISRPSADWPGAAILALSSVGRQHYAPFLTAETLRTAHVGGAMMKGNKEVTIEPTDLMGAGKESGELEYDAPIVLALACNTNDRQDKAGNVIRNGYLAVVKNRLGEAGGVYARTYPQSGLWALGDAEMWREDKPPTEAYAESATKPGSTSAKTIADPGSRW